MDLDYLKTKYPEMFTDCYGGVAVGDGWHDLVDTLTNSIYTYVTNRRVRREYLTNNNPHNLPIPEYMEFPAVRQIKEKFGGLRYYIDGGDEYIAGMIDFAEYMSVKICEECGAPGRQRSGGWIRTLCDTHEAEYQARKSQM